MLSPGAQKELRRSPFSVMGAPRKPWGLLGGTRGPPKASPGRSKGALGTPRHPKVPPGRYPGALGAPKGDRGDRRGRWPEAGAGDRCARVSHHAGDDGGPGTLRIAHDSIDRVFCYSYALYDIIIFNAAYTYLKY